MKCLYIALLGAAVAAPAAAQSVQFSAIAEGQIGYGTNPFLAPDVTEGSAFVSASVAPRLFYQTARSTTTLQGQYKRDTYLHDFGYTDSGTVGLIRTDQLTQYLGTTLTASFVTTNQNTITDPNQVIVNPLDVGRRTKTLQGSYQLQWQASARDQLSSGATISHQTYGNGKTSGVSTVASDYTQVGANVGYNHAVDARTTVGAQVSLSAIHSQLYPNSRTIQPALTVKRQLSAAWEVDGHVGVILSHVEGPLARSSTSLGLGLNLCGTYPRTHICFRINRDTSPSGYGPLRTTNSVTAELSHNLTEHSHLTFQAQYAKDNSDSVAALPTSPIVRDSKFLLGSAEYDRDITQRISAGFGGKYKQRELTGYPDAHSYEATIHVRAKLGRM